MLQKTCVNVLQQAASISTLCMFKCSRYSIKGVNALQRAASISTLKENSLFLDGTLVSMPFNGLTSFLQVLITKIMSICVVSMPFNGLTSFLHALCIFTQNN